MVTKWLALVVGVALVSMVQAQSDDATKILAKFESQIDALLKQKQPDLFKWHLRSLRALARTQYATLSLEQQEYLRRPLKDHSKEFVDYLTTISKGFEGDCANPDCYLKDGNRPLILGFASNIEGSTQYFMLDLPRGFDPKKPYPLSIGLHGTGPDNALAYPSFGLGPRDKAPEPSTKEPMLRLTPWGRGNRGWRGDGERDLFEAINIVKTIATTNPDRWYITGHSAGGDGSWAIVQHTPDLWAAAGMQSGSMFSGRPEWGLIPNMAYVPFHVMIGDGDTLPNRISDSKEASRLLGEMGGDTRFLLIPNTGHYPLPASAYEDQEKWMFAYTRKRPLKFSFTIDQFIHSGVWGVNAVFDSTQRQLIMQPWPHFEVKIASQTVSITTSGIKRLTVDLGPNGLQMKGDVTLQLNGKEVFKGKVPDKPLGFDLAP